MYANSNVIIFDLLIKLYMDLSIFLGIYWTEHMLIYMLMM